jgi:Yip1 domain
MIDKVKNILVNPKGQFEKSEKEEAPAMMTSFTSYVALLFLIPAVFTIIGWGVIGYNVVFVSIKSWEVGIKLGIALYVACVATFFATTYLIDALAPSFKSTKNLNRSAQLTALAITPAVLFVPEHVNAHDIRCCI